MGKIKNILFDFGGVIVTLSPETAVKRFTELGLPDAEKRLNIYTQSGIFGDLERGRISDEEFISQLSKLTGRSQTWDGCQYAWLGYCKQVPQRNLDTLTRLRVEGYRVVLLSNTNPFMMGWALSDRFDGQGRSLSHYMDAIYMSYKCGAMKPDAAFFNHVLSNEGIDPAETLFLDDGQRNVEAASQLGINTMLTINGEDWTKEIYKHLV
jgi:5-amino-6-(5-phospho-D-ribitylamino)uracil phosphatase